MLHWAAVCRQGPTAPIKPLDKWKDWLLPDVHGFYKWARVRCRLGRVG